MQSLKRESHLISPTKKFFNSPLLSLHPFVVEAKAMNALQCKCITSMEHPSMDILNDIEWNIHQMDRMQIYLLYVDAFEAQRV